MNTSRLTLTGVLALVVLVTRFVSADEFENLVQIEPPTMVPEEAYLVEGGEYGTLDEFEGKAILLNFWATWCPPCIEEMPSIDRLAERLAGPDFVVITMAMEMASEEEIRAFYERVEVEHLGIYRDPSMQLARALRTWALPTTYLIDHTGMVRAMLVGEATWDSDEAVALIAPYIEAARANRLGEDSSSSSES